MSIPSGTKFHGVAPGVDTENRGSANANADRNAYTIEEFNGTSFKAWLVGPPLTGTGYFRYDRVAFITESASNPTNFPTVDLPNSSNDAPSSPNDAYRDDFPAIGIIMAGKEFKREAVVDVVVQGFQSPASVFYAPGLAPEVGDNLYAGQGGQIVGASVGRTYPTGAGPGAGDYFALGTVTGQNPVKTVDYGLNGAIWEVEAYYSFPSQSRYHIDGIAYNSSLRQPCSLLAGDQIPESDIARVGDIVKTSGPSVPSTSIYFIAERVSSSDPVESFVGIVPDNRKSPGSLPTDDVKNVGMVCMSGNLFLPAWVINGVDPVGGSIIYADATTPYKLTTDSTSGTVIGLVQHLTFDESGAIERVLIQVKL